MANNLFRKRGTTQIVDPAGATITDPSIIGGIADIGQLPIFGEGVEPREPRDTEPSGLDLLRTKLGEAITTGLKGFGDIKTDIETQRKTQRETALEQLDTALAEIDARVARRVEEERVTEFRKLGEARGISIRGGLAGSPFAAARKEGVRETTRRAITGFEELGDIEKQKVRGQTTQVLLNIQDRAQQRIEAAQTQRLGLLTKGVEFLEGVKKDALADLSALAGTGMVTPSEFQASGLGVELAEQTGLSELHIDLLFNAQSQQAQRIDYQYFWRGNQLVGVGQDPQTGQMKTQTYDATDLGIDIGISPEFITNEVTGEVFWWDKENPQTDEQGNLIMKSLGKMKEGEKPGTTEQVIEWKEGFMEDKAAGMLWEDTEDTEGNVIVGAKNRYGAFLPMDWMEEMYGIEEEKEVTEKKKYEETYYKEWNEWMQKVKDNPDKYYVKDDKVYENIKWKTDKVVFPKGK